MKNQPNNDIFHTTSHLFRECSGKMVAVLTKYYGIKQLENIMDAVQDSFEAALKYWRYKDMPNNPEAWLLTTAKNKLLNVIKRENTLANLASSIAAKIHFPPNEKQIIDSQLHLLLRICELKLSPKSQIIFTLYTSCGFGVPEIANALLMANEAVKKNIYRTKQLLQHTTFNFDALPASEITEDLSQLHLVLYLMFNEGYKTTRDKEGLNIDLCYEALRLAKLILLQQLENAATNALLALMCFNIARFPARVSSQNLWIPLEQQDRSLWNPVFIKEGMHYLNKAKNTEQLNKYHLEAIIASVYCSAADFKTTDWSKITYLYQQLELLEGSSFVFSLNKIIAISYIALSKNLLDELMALEKELKSEHRFFFYLTKAHLTSLLNQHLVAKKSYEQALTYAQSEIDKQFILNKIAELVLVANTLSN